MCHIAITPLIYDYEVTISDIDLLFRFELLLGPNDGMITASCGHLTVVSGST